ncbi:MFS antiporter QDR3 [Candida parapsilosis]|nr:MFS antiporter QDR3 [Candida parapsilosis]KAI5908387.1 MFS antiporter QDR3 [Candida parapsilosis]
MTSIDDKSAPVKEELESASVDVEPEISEEHKQYLIAKHGTYHLSPLPTMNDNDPLNWSNGMKFLQLGMVAFHGFMTTFLTTGLVPVAGVYAQKFNMPTSRIAYLISVQILVVGVFPIVWVPFMDRYGKRLLLIISTVGSMAFSLGSVFCNTYGSMMAMRIMQSVFISPGIAVGGSIVNETTFSHQRGSRSGIWAISVNLGTMVGAFLMGFVAGHQDAKYIHVVFTCINFGQAVCYVFLGKESSYNYNDLTRNEPNRFKQLRFKTIFPENRITLKRIVYPLKFFGNLKIFIPTFAYSVCFLQANIAMNIEIPEVMVAKFALGPQALGLQFISFIIGTAIGEVGGYMSDRLVAWGQKNGKGPSFRLWLTYPGFIACCVGLIIFGVQIEHAKTWNVTPLVGCAFASFGLQIMTSPIIAFCIDMDHKDASAIVVFITAVRQVLAFIGPFYFPHMYSDLGFAKSYGIMASLIGALSLIPMFILHYLAASKGK